MYLKDLINKFIYENGDKNIQETFSYGALGKLYKLGWKLCSNCSILFRINNLYCPFCGLMLRTRPKNKRGKKIDR